jgi:hypothetical protein
VYVFMVVLSQVCVVERSILVMEQVLRTGGDVTVNSH